MRMETKQFCCTECGNQYQWFKSLRIHVKQKHPEKADTIAPLPDRRFKCCECEKPFNNKDFLSRHERKIHNIEYVKPHQLYQCAMCEVQHIRKNNILQHMSEVHNLNLVPEILEFVCEEDFLNWKTNEENNTNCRYVSTGGKPKKRKIRSQTFTCHRSNYYKNKGSSKRSLKSQGSCKLGALCPAEIKYTESDGHCRVEFIKEHSHKVELGHIQLRREERSLIAKKIAAGIPFDTILDEIRKSICPGDEVQRLHLLTRKDLHNIKNSFNLRGTIKCHQNDAVSVDAQVREEVQRPDFCILGKENSLNNMCNNLKENDDSEISAEISRKRPVLNDNDLEEEKESIRTAFNRLLENAAREQLQCIKKHLLAMTTTFGRRKRKHSNYT